MPNCYLIFTHIVYAYPRYWAITYGHPYPDFGYGPGVAYPYSIQITSGGGYIIVGQAYIPWVLYDLLVLKLDQNGNIEWHRIAISDGFYSWARAVQLADDEGYVIAGRKGFWGLSDDFWILKIDADGNVQWQKAYGSEMADKAYCLEKNH